MSLLGNILSGEDGPAKQLAYLLNIVKQMGWESFTDTRVIKPNLRRTQIFLKNKSVILDRLFNVKFEQIGRHEIVNIINPFLISMWHVQIIGSESEASLQLLQSKA